MNAGQITMMAPLPTGVGLSAATSVPDTVTAPSAAGQLDSGFAGMLSGMSSVVTTQPAGVAGAEKPGGSGAPDTTKQAAVVVQQPEVQPDVMAMLLAAMGSGNQLSPANAALSGNTQEKSAKVVQADASKPQNVASSTAGAQPVPPDVLAMLLAATGNGNPLPPTNAPTTKDEQENSAKAVQSDAPMPQDVALSAAGAQIAPLAQTDGRMPESGAVADDVVQQSSPIGAIAATMVPVNNAGSQTDGSMVQTGAGETTSGMVAIGDITGTQQSPGLAPLEQGMMQAARQAVAVKFEGTLPIPPARISNMESKSPVQAISVPPKTTVPVSQADVAASVTAAAAQAPGGETGDKTETLPSGSTIPGAKDTQTAPAKGQITAGNVAAVSTVSETSADKLNVADIGKEVSKVVSGFSTAVNSSAGNQQRADHTPEKPAVMAEGAAKSSVVSPLATAKDDLTDSSDPGSSGKKFDDFMPKSAETPTNVTQQVAGGHQLFSAETLTSAPPQPSQAEAVRPDSHEQVARQVQEQLTGYSLKQGNDQITLKLSPDHLGDIKVNLSLEDQHLKVQIVTETTTARDSLLQHVDSLKESLARQNISIDKFDVTTGGGGTGSQSNNNAQGAWSELAKNRQSQQWLSTGGYRTSPVATVPLAPMYLVQTEHAMVDVHF